MTLIKSVMFYSCRTTKAERNQSSSQIAEIGRVYYFTVEFGAVREGGRLLAYGAGTAGAVGEMEHFLSEKAKFEPFNPA